MTGAPASPLLPVATVICSAAGALVVSGGGASRPSKAAPLLEALIDAAGEEEVPSLPSETMAMPLLLPEASAGALGEGVILLGFGSSSLFGHLDLPFWGWRPLRILCG